MNDLSKLVKLILNSIELSENKKDLLKTKLSILKDKIESNLKESYTLEYITHGSFVLNTITRPIDVNSTFDIDFGVYFVESQEPAYKAKTYKNWIYEIIENHTDSVEFKNKCLRVNYSTSDDLPSYHVDIPVFHKYKQNIKFVDNDEWKDSDPEAFIEWFNDANEKSNDKIRFITLMLKWLHSNITIKTPSGLVTSILVSNNFSDDVEILDCFYKTLNNILIHLDYKFSCQRPTHPVGEELFSTFTEIQECKYIEFLKKIIESIDDINSIDDLNLKSQKLLKLLKVENLSQMKIAFEEWKKQMKFKENLNNGKIFIKPTGGITLEKQKISAKNTEFYGKRK